MKPECKVCRQPIQPGQLYIANGPLHVYCSDVRAPGREELGATELAARARMGHFDDYFAPADVADGAEAEADDRAGSQHERFCSLAPDHAGRCEL